MLVNNRYSRQILLEKIKERGQKKLSRSHVTIIGCGALGSNIANNLARSGIGHIRIVDRDLVELNNLQRQSLFDEDDVGYAKASVAAKKLRRINSEIQIDPIVEDVTYENIESIIAGTNVVLDGTDNMPIRFLINDACIKNKVAWIYGGAIGTYGMSMNIIPGKTPCFRCIIQELPHVGSLPTCDTVGVLNTIPAIIASIESTEAIKILLDEDVNTDLLVYDVWHLDFNLIKIRKRENCECCNKHNFEFLNAKKKETVMPLCGSNAVQITPIKRGKILFEELEKNLCKIGEVSRDEIVLKLRIPDYELNIFRDGRTIIYGTNDKKIAKSLYAKYVGL